MDSGNARSTCPDYPSHYQHPLACILIEYPVTRAQVDNQKSVTNYSNRCPANERRLSMSRHVTDKPHSLHAIKYRYMYHISSYFSSLTRVDILDIP